MLVWGPFLGQRILGELSLGRLVLLGYDGAYIYGIGCFSSGCTPSVCLLGSRLAFPFLQSPIIESIFDSCPTIT